MPSCWYMFDRERHDEGWPVVNGVMVKIEGRSLLDYSPNFALYIQRDNEWCLWDKVEASSRQAASDYFSGQYPRETRSVVGL